MRGRAIRYRHSAGLHMFSWLRGSLDLQQAMFECLLLVKTGDRRLEKPNRACTESASHIKTHTIKMSCVNSIYTRPAHNEKPADQNWRGPAFSSTDSLTGMQRYQAHHTIIQRYESHETILTAIFFRDKLRIGKKGNFVHFKIK